MTKMHLLWFSVFSPHSGFGLAALSTLLQIDLSTHALDHRSSL